MIIGALAVPILAACTGNGQAPDAAAIAQVMEREDAARQVQVSNLNCSPAGQKGQWGCSFDFKGMVPRMGMGLQPYEKKGMAYKVEREGALWVRVSF